MMKRTIGLAVAALTVLLLSSGAAQLAGRRDQPQGRTARRDNPEARTAAVITHPPTGWGNPVDVSKLPAESTWPTVAVDNNGKAYVAWEEWYGGVGAPRSMAFNTNYSGAWAAPQENKLSYVAIDDSGYVTIACDPSDGTAYLAYHDADWANGNMEVVMVEYTRGVKSFEGFISRTPGASDYVNLCVDPNNRFLYAMWFDDVSGSDTFELVYRWLNPTTKAWLGGNLVPVFVGRSKYWREMAIDKKGTAHLVFNLRSPTEVWYTKNPTPQNEDTWTTPVAVSGNTEREWVWPRIAIDGDGDVYVVWSANTGGYDSGTEEVWLKRTVGGVWQAPINLSNSPTRSDGATVAVDPKTKDIYVAWHEFISGENYDIYLRMYTDQSGGGAKAWGDIYNMTNNPSESAQPCIRVDGQGGIHLVYYDSPGANREIYYMQKLGIGAPSDITVESTLNSTEDQKTNTLKWVENPSNAGLSLASYKIYRKRAEDPDSAFAFLAQVSYLTFTYADAGLPAIARYAYRLSSVTSEGMESGQSATILDKPGVFAPTGVSLKTAADKVLFYEIKDNTITFSANGNNAPGDVAGYNVYRKKAAEENTALELLGSTTASVLRYTDAQLRGGQKYAYALKTKFKDGREGGFSALVAEE